MKVAAYITVSIALSCIFTRLLYCFPWTDYLFYNGTKFGEGVYVFLSNLFGVDAPEDIDNMFFLLAWATMLCIAFAAVWLIQRLVITPLWYKRTGRHLDQK